MEQPTPLDRKARGGTLPDTRGEANVHAFETHGDSRIPLVVRRRAAAAVAVASAACVLAVDPLLLAGRRPTLTRTGETPQGLEVSRSISSASNDSSEER